MKCELRNGEEKKQKMAQMTATAGNEKVGSFGLLSGHIIPAIGLGTWKAQHPRDNVYAAIVEVLILLFSAVFPYSIVFDYDINLKKERMVFVVRAYVMSSAHYLIGVSFVVVGAGWV